MKMKKTMCLTWLLTMALALMMPVATSERSLINNNIFSNAAAVASSDASSDDPACGPDANWTRSEIFALVTISGSDIDGIEELLLEAYRNILEDTCSGVFEILDLFVDREFNDTVTATNLTLPIVFDVRCRGFGCDEIESAFNEAAGSLTTNRRRLNEVDTESTTSEVTNLGYSKDGYASQISSKKSTSYIKGESSTSSKHTTLRMLKKNPTSGNKKNPAILFDQKSPQLKKTKPKAPKGPTAPKLPKKNDSTPSPIGPPAGDPLDPNIDADLPEAPSGAPSNAPTMTETETYSPTEEPELYCGCVLPSRDEFRDEFNLLEPDDRIVISRITSLTAVDCPQTNLTVDTFTSNLVMTIRVNGTAPTQADADALGRVTLETYNQENLFNPDVCDRSFREARAATVTISATYNATFFGASQRRRLNSRSSTFYAYVGINGKCRNCRRTALSNNVSARRRLIEKISTEYRRLSEEPNFDIEHAVVSPESNDDYDFIDGYGALSEPFTARKLTFNFEDEGVDDDGICFCPMEAAVDNATDVTPSRVEFRDRVSSSISSLSQQGGFFDGDFDSLDDLLETEERDCPVDQDIFSFNIGLAVAVESSVPIDPADFFYFGDIVAESIESTYNIEALEFCDERFRFIDFANPDAPAPTANPFDGVNTTGTQIYFFDITIEYFGDDVDDTISGLFSNDRRLAQHRNLRRSKPRRSLSRGDDFTGASSGQGDDISHASKYGFRMRRNLQTDTDVCYCGVGSSGDPVDEATFLEALSHEVNLYSDGELSGIRAISEYELV